MTDEWLYGIHQWQIFLASVALQTVAALLMRALGDRARRHGDTTDEHVVSALQAATLALLGLLIGFTFSMALTRFEARRLLAVDEASAITTAALHADLPGVATDGVLRTLRDYAIARVAFGQSYDVDSGRHALAVAESERLQRELWRYAREASQADPHSQSAALFVRTVAEVVELHDRRTAALGAHVPQPVLVLLHCIAVIAAGFTGLAAGLAGARNRLVTPVMIVLVTTVIMLVFDLDRPQRGVIIAPQAAMVEAARKLESQAPRGP